MTWYAAIYLQLSMFVGFSWGLARMLGAQIDEAVVGWPKLLKLRAGETKIALGPLAFTSYTMPRGRADEDGAWWKVPLASRLLILLGPWVIIGLIALLLRGGESLLNGLSQVFVTVDTTPLFRALFALRLPFLAVFGIVCAKLAVTNLAISALGVAGEFRKKPSIGTSIVALLVFLWVGGRFAWGLIHALIT